MLETLILCGMLSCYPPSDVPPTYYAERMIEDKEYVGDYELTAYTWTGNTCADGIYPKSGVTVASNDPKLWHKNICIEGYGVFYVHDTGGMSKNVIDIYMDSREECIQFGRKKNVAVYVID